MTDSNVIDLATNIQWDKATFANIVGKGYENVQNPDDLIFHSTKIAGPDGFTAGFYKKAWLIIKGDLIATVQSISMKLLKWTPDFDPSKELSIVPIWFKLPGLQLHFFNHKVLFNIGKALGRPLKLDAPTFNLSRPSVARILIERNITLPAVEEIWLGTEHSGYWRKIIAEQSPYYCHHCKMFGHTDEKCFRLHPNLRRKLPRPNSEGLEAQGNEMPTVDRIAA
ncbi:uncharacterized protein LOC110037571 [Phalaenopsis equestris]|uniref:uncharacterized protein LOC110037571 n=1 Tax=Phalaenopsis equestris TaxID=78828 RepID=UPI0009E354C9|nr:uncharacterized protein LOC110037571 [Phalaenopsis equestris]